MSSLFLRTVLKAISIVGGRIQGQPEHTNLRVPAWCWGVPPTSTDQTNPTSRDMYVMADRPSSTKCFLGDITTCPHIWYTWGTDTYRWLKHASLICLRGSLRQFCTWLLCWIKFNCQFTIKGDNMLKKIQGDNICHRCSGGGRGHQRVYQNHSWQINWTRHLRYLNLYI